MDASRILPADDEQALSGCVALSLERGGLAVGAVPDGEGALCHVLQKHPDLSVLDLLVPALRGRQAGRQLRATGDSTCLIGLAHMNAPVKKLLILEKGADDYPRAPSHPCAEMEAISKAAEIAVDAGLSGAILFCKYDRRPPYARG